MLGDEGKGLRSGESAMMAEDETCSVAAIRLRSRESVMVAYELQMAIASTVGCSLLIGGL